MDNIVYILFLCIVSPLILMLALLDRKSRLTVGFMIIGIAVCLLASEVNNSIQHISGESIFFMTTRCTPVVEEILKGIPVLYFAFAVSNRRENVLSVAMAVGIGFAILENAYILVNHIDTVSILWALVRGLGSGLMHGICTVAVGFGVSFVKKRRKLFCTGTFALLSLAITYHATYNCLVQSRFPYAGFLLPLITYCPVLMVWFKKRKRG